MYNIIKHEWVDPVSISILNRVLYPYVRVTVFADLTESENSQMMFYQSYHSH